MEWIKTSEIVASAKDQAGITHSSLDNYFKRLAIRAEKEIRSGQTISLFNISKMEVQGNTLKLPEGLITVEKVIGYRGNSNQGIMPKPFPSSFYICEKESPNLKVGHSSQDTTSDTVLYPYSTNSFAQGGDYFIQEYYPFTFEVQRNYMYFSDDCNFDFVDLSYKGYYVEDGELLVPENHERAIEAYILWSHKLEDINATGAQAQTYARVWAEQKTNVRGQDGLISREKQQWAEKFLRSLVSPKRVEY